MAIRYIAVNLKHEAYGIDCACCQKAIKKTYVREIGTGIIYHTGECLALHIRICEQTLRKHREKVDG